MAVQKANYIYRDFVTDGVPSSGINKPKKSEIRERGTWVEDAINAGLSNGGLIYDTKANMTADLAHPANASAWVVADGTAANNGIYRKSGASGTGSWTRIADLPYSVLYAQNAGSGTANAVVATASLAVVTTPYSQLISVPFTAANTGVMTLAINGETPRALVTNSGEAIPAGYVTAGMSALVQIDSAGNYRLFSYGDASAIQAAVEALLVSATAEADRAEAAAGAIADAPQWAFATKADAALFEPVTAPGFIGIYGLPYDKVGATPTYGGAAIKDGTPYLLRKTPAVYLEAFRDDLDLDGTGDSTAAYNKALGYMAQEGARKLVLPNEATIYGTWTIDRGDIDIDFNGCLLKVHPDQSTNAFAVNVAGSVSATAYQLSSDHGRGATFLSCTTTDFSDIAAGDIIKFEDDSVRLDSGQAQINVELLRVAAVGTTIGLAEPSNARKKAWSGNIRKVNLLPNVNLLNGRTLNEIGRGNGGLLLQYLGPGSCIDWISNEQGVSAAMGIRSCWGVDAKLRYAGPAQLIGGGQGYGISIIRGSRFIDADVYGIGQRHTLDIDSSWDIRGRVVSEQEQVSTVYSHNGKGGRISIDADMVDCVTSGIWGANWSGITGQGTQEDIDSTITGLKVRARIQQRRSSSADNYGLLAGQILNDCDIEITAVSGNGQSYDTLGPAIPAAARFFPRGNTGRAKINSRGHKIAAVLYSATEVQTGLGEGLELDIDVDWASYAVYANGVDNLNIGRLSAGANIDTSILSVTNTSNAYLRRFRLENFTSKLSSSAKYASITGTGVGTTNGRGVLGQASPILTGLAVSGNFAIGRNDMIAYGSVIKLAPSTTSALTSIDNGIFEGQTLIIQSSGFTVTLTTLSNLVLAGGASSTTANVTMFTWFNGKWWQI